MAVPFIPLPADAFPEAARPSIERLNVFLLELSRLEGTIRQPIQSRRSDQSIARRDTFQVDVSRITPSIAEVVSGVSTVVGTPALTLSTTNVVGSTTTALSVNSTVALFGTQPPMNLSGTSAVGTSAYAARADHVHDAFDTTAPAALATAAATGSVDFAARRDHVHEFPPTLQSTANDSTLTLTDDATDQTLTGSLGVLNIVPGTGVDIDFPNSTAGTLNIRANTTTAASSMATFTARPAAGTRNILTPVWSSPGSTDVFTSQAFTTWLSQFGTFGGSHSSSTFVAFDNNLMTFTPQSGSGSSNTAYGFRSLTFAINNANATWNEVATAFFRGVRRSITSPLIEVQATLIIEPPTAAVSTSTVTIGSSQIGLYIRQQAAQATAADRIAIKVDAQNSGTNRYSFYGVSDTLYQGGIVSIGGALRHTGAQIGLHGSSSIAQSTGWSASGFTASKTLNGASFSLNEVMSVLNTLITHFVARGDLAA